MGIQAIALQLRGLVSELIPEANELIWDNYNAVAIAYSKSFQLKDAFCHIAVYSKHVNLGFNRGAELTGATIGLAGKGRLIRHIKVTDMETFPEAAVKRLILEAVLLSEAINPDLKDKISEGESKLMSVSDKKIRPGKT
ncbi:DUF1801 domain-containing protein [Robiginitalea aurantiaca]|uniref:DUF1801 domain-containing protein n=1 Tax=Robiginitalea aurantiaca TaxID=3056915 RepID=A0ABT7WGW7_9FLAO|nr:DUF1801 domain-containing protein [Robiginitalea aurantiaca]MDM9632160.1 DUF1801 domain-containing protein [Robiginitalea aurantiaca]